MSSVLQHQHHYEFKGDVWGPRKACKIGSYRILISTKMAVGTPVQDHILKMMDSLNELGVLGAAIDTES